MFTATVNNLEAVKRAARAKTRADAHYRAAILAALANGHGYATIGEALGVSRQAVRQYAGRLETKT